MYFLAHFSSIILYLSILCAVTLPLQKRDLYFQSLLLRISSQCCQLFLGICLILPNGLIFTNFVGAKKTFKIAHRNCKILGCRDPRCKHENPRISIGVRWNLIKLHELHDVTGSHKKSHEVTWSHMKLQEVTRSYMKLLKKVL